jgi:Fis family transcriptional regulator, factor for inversion stimulation protein|tara:strand:- start:62 stop:298 length:237 start_codon:yes stop_codon:yes gene_type:complete
MSKANLSNDIDILLDRYFNDLSGENPSGVYDMVVQSVEKPLLLYVMNLAEGNQSKAANILGLNRNTLRKKLKLHKIET